MPLSKGKSKQAFSKNVKIEMKHGRPQKQALAIAFSVQRKAGKKKMAKGGPVSAKTEKRSNIDMQDMEELSRNRGDKAPSQDSWTDRPDIRQSAKGPKTTRIKHPSMTQSPVFKVRMRDEEDDFIDSDPPASPKEQPPMTDDEEEADKSGPDTPALHMKRMAKGGMINDMMSMSRAEEDNVQHPAHLEEDNDQITDPEAMDDHMDMYAHGGDIDGNREQEEDHEDSIAAAIMARRDRLHADIDSGAYDLDEAVRMAEGGEILDESNYDDIHSHGSMDTHESDDQVDLSRNADEDANEEDQASFDALRKENYNESEGLDELDNPRDSGQKRPKLQMDVNDMSDKIRSRMKAKRQFKAR